MRRISHTSSSVGFAADVCSQPQCRAVSPRTAVRIIPCLDIRAGRVVKGTQFRDLVDSGDPAELAARYEAEGADEIALLDISATQEDRKAAPDTVASVRDAISIPLTVGGGIRSVSDACRLLESGADRVSINSAAVRDPSLVGELSRRFGVQCVVVAIDVKKSGTEGVCAWNVCIEAGTIMCTGLDVAAWARRCSLEGAGEILLTSIDRDGTASGYDLPLLRNVCGSIEVPVIASGGASRPEHFLGGIEAGARAVLAAGVFHRGELKIETLKRYLSAQDVEVRPC